MAPPAPSTVFDQAVDHQAVAARCADVGARRSAWASISGGAMREAARGRRPERSAPPARRGPDIGREQLAALDIETLALMHGPAFTGDCRAALADLAADFDRRIAARRIDGTGPRSDATE